MHDDTVARTPQVMAAMQEELKYTGIERCDQWQHENFAISRIHHGIVNPDRQPIFSQKGEKSLCIVFDGEVFGYARQRELLDQRGYRAQLRNNDAEYCLHLYDAFGKDAFGKLNGSFLIVLYHIASRELLVVNDRFSSRPLFYHYRDRSLAFGSQLRPILKFPGLPRVLDQQAIYEFFTFQRILEDRTYYRDVKVLPPATILQFQNGNITFHRYWKIQYNTKFDSTENYVEALASTLRQAVARRSKSPHRLGLLLSAGLDSRSVLAALDSQCATYTLGNFRNQEVRIAEHVASAKGCSHSYLERNDDYYFTILDQAIDIGDGMHAYFHAHFLGLLPVIKEDVTILLHGHGLDYTFQGLYLPLKLARMFGRKLTIPYLDDLKFETLAEKLYRNVNYDIRNGSAEKLFRYVTQDRLREQILDSIHSILNSFTSKDANVFNAWDYFVLHSLYKHFTFLNITCLRAYLEERTVIVDNDLFDLYLGMPPSARLGGTVLRKALRCLSPELASVANPKTDFRMDLPFSFQLAWAIRTAKDIFKTGKKILSKPKLSATPQSTHLVYTQGSWPNMNELIRQHGKLKQLIHDTIHDKKCLDPEIFDIESISRHLESHLRGRDLNELLLSLLTFGRWHKKYGP